MSLALPALYARSLSTASKAVNLPTIKDETQQLIHSTLRDLKDIHSRIIELSLFSPNETLEDISTRDLVYLFVPYALSEVQGRVRTLERTERMVSLVEAEKYLKSFFALLENYQIVPEEERVLYIRKASDTTDAARRRELKINQFKKEKDIKARIETVRKRLGQTAVSEDYITNFDIIASLLPSTPTAVKEQKEIDSEIEDILRETTLLVLRLVFAQSHSQLESMEQELELLRNAPPSPRFAPPSDDQRGKQRQSEDNMWKLDAPVPTGGPDGKGSLMDANGKPLRPFTILPSDAGERARLQQQVFGPGYNLPTMSIDEYLQIENERGNIITGGGAASQEAPTSSEQLALDAEMDGTREGREKEEQKRQKDEKWARYTDENPKGAGNTMNRG